MLKSRRQSYMPDSDDFSSLSAALDRAKKDQNPQKSQLHSESEPQLLTETVSTTCNSSAASRKDSLSLSSSSSDSL